MLDFNQVGGSTMSKPYPSLSQALEEKISSGEVAKEQICRTCAHGGIKQVLGCDPENPEQLRTFDIAGNSSKVHTDGSVPVVLRDKPINQILAVDGRPSEPSRYLSSCGWQSLEKCRTCANFKAVKITVRDGNTDAGRPRLREITVGGHCAIGPEGIVQGTKVVHCLRKPLPTDVSSDFRRSCATCRYNVGHWDISMLDHATPLEYDLNLYQADQIRKNADPNEIGLEIAAARRAAGQIRFPAFRGATRQELAWTGLSRFYKLDIVPGSKTYQSVIDSKTGHTKEVPRSWKVTLQGTGEHLELFADNSDDRFGLITQVNSNQLMVQIHAPWYKLLNLPDRAQITHYILPHTKCEHCSDGICVEDNGDTYYCPVCENGSKIDSRASKVSYKSEALKGQKTEVPGKDEVAVPDIARIDPDCVARGLDQNATSKNSIYCHPLHGPCYYHSKAPVKQIRHEWELDDIASGSVKAHYEVNFNPPTIASIRTESPERIITFNGSIFVDGNGSPAHPTMVVLRLRSLLANERRSTERDKMLKAALVTLGALPRSVPKLANYSWNRPSQIEPRHPFCALNEYDKAHGGHIQGSPDIEIEEVSADGTRVTHARGVNTRGFDFAELWNDRFGTPRSDQSTNPTMALEGGGLVKDPAFCLPRFQERMEFERVASPGERAQEDALVTEAWISLKREVAGIIYEQKEMPEESMTAELGWALPIEADVQFATRDALLEALDKPMFIEGNDQTRTKGFWTTMREVALGYNLHNNSHISDLDIASIADTRAANMMPDPVSEKDEADEVLVCSVCWDGSGDAGVFSPSEITDPELGCPSGDGGILILRTKRSAWLSRLMTVDGDQVRLLMPTYRRGVNEEIASAPDTPGWQQNQRLANMGCEHWTPRKRM